ncbi:hypothetical protein, partial [Asticcacaulis sp.]|uniref:hypothetical protein n=1 Tax=Asticcacaulis sp. TaxID=1872648 RepID=UPI00260EC0D4
FLCMAILMFATKKPMHGVAFLVNAIVGVVLIWKWDWISSMMTSESQPTRMRYVFQQGRNPYLTISDPDDE